MVTVSCSVFRVLFCSVNSELWMYVILLKIIQSWRFRYKYYFIRVRFCWLVVIAIILPCENSPQLMKWRPIIVIINKGIICQVVHNSCWNITRLFWLRNKFWQLHFIEIHSPDHILFQFTIIYCHQQWIINAMKYIKLIVFRPSKYLGELLLYNNSDDDDIS